MHDSEVAHDTARALRRAAARRRPAGHAAPAGTKRWTGPTLWVLLPMPLRSSPRASSELPTIPPKTTPVHDEAAEGHFAPLTRFRPRQTFAYRVGRQRDPSPFHRPGALWVNVANYSASPAFCNTVNRIGAASRNPNPSRRSSSGRRYSMTPLSFATRSTPIVPDIRNPSAVAMRRA